MGCGVETADRAGVRAGVLQLQLHLQTSVSDLPVPGGRPAVRVLHPGEDQEVLSQVWNLSSRGSQQEQRPGENSCQVLRLIIIFINIYKSLKSNIYFIFRQLCINI